MLYMIWSMKASSQCAHTWLPESGLPLPPPPQPPFEPVSSESVVEDWSPSAELADDEVAADAAAALRSILKAFPFRRLLLLFPFAGGMGCTGWIGPFGPAADGSTAAAAGAAPA